MVLKVLFKFIDYQIIKMVTDEKVSAKRENYNLLANYYSKLIIDN